MNKDAKLKNIRMPYLPQHAAGRTETVSVCLQKIGKRFKVKGISAFWRKIYWCCKGIRRAHAISIYKLHLNDVMPWLRRVLLMLNLKSMSRITYFGFSMLSLTTTQTWWRQKTVTPSWDKSSAVTPEFNYILETVSFWFTRWICKS